MAKWFRRFLTVDYGIPNEMMILILLATEDIIIGVSIDLIPGNNCLGVRGAGCYDIIGLIKIENYK